MVYRGPVPAGTVRFTLTESEDQILDQVVSGYVGHAKVYVGDGVYVLAFIHAWEDVGWGAMKIRIEWPKKDQLRFGFETDEAELKWNSIVTDAWEEFFDEYLVNQEKAKKKAKVKRPPPEDPDLGDEDFAQYFQEQEEGFNRWQESQKRRREHSKQETARKARMQAQANKQGQNQERTSRPPPVKPHPMLRPEWLRMLSMTGQESEEEARGKWRKLMRTAHPDLHGGSTKRSQEINEAWQAVCRVRGWK